MPTERLLSDDLLAPIPGGSPSGVNLRWTPEWDKIEEARRSDDGLNHGQLAKKNPKKANWHLVEELTSTALRTESKDLAIAMYLTEAELKLHGFRGLGEGLHLMKELMARYWDQGLYPSIESGPEDRAGPVEWLGAKLVDSIIALSITRRSDTGEDYSVANWKQAADGGNASMEMYQAAVNKTALDDYEQLYLDVEQAHTEFKALEKVVDEKFGEKAAPNLSDCRNILTEVKQEVSERLEKKRPVSQADIKADSQAANDGPVAMRFPLSGLGAQTDAKSSWREAEQLIRSGKVDAGLAAMTRLAANETSGRNRFQRKLLLAEVCLTSRRTQLARAILEELAEQIEKFHLEDWESSELVCGVWAPLYRLYNADSSYADRAKELFEKLCRLDPWQALACGE